MIGGIAKKKILTRPVFATCESYSHANSQTNYSQRPLIDHNQAFYYIRVHKD